MSRICKTTVMVLTEEKFNALNVEEKIAYANSISTELSELNKRFEAVKDLLKEMYPLGCPDNGLYKVTYNPKATVWETKRINTGKTEGKVTRVTIH